MREVNDFVPIILQARQDLDDLKRKQFAGSSNLHIVENQTGNTWDVNGNFLTSHLYFFTFYFVADQQKAPFVAFKPYVLIDGVEWNMQGESFYEFEDTYPPPVGLTPDEIIRSALASYQLFAPSPVTINVKIKMRALANDTGTLGVLTRSFS